MDRPEIIKAQSQIKVALASMETVEQQIALVQWAANQIGCSARIVKNAGVQPLIRPMFHDVPTSKPERKRKRQQEWIEKFD